MGWARAGNLLREALDQKEFETAWADGVDAFAVERARLQTLISDVRPAAQG